jgi:hypothetical protein
MCKGRLITVACVLAATPASVALAFGTDDVVIYATNHLGHYPNLGTDTLIRFNASNPEKYVTIGSLGVVNKGFGGLEFDSDGNLWAYATFNNFGGAASGLYSINLQTGAAAVQGTISSQTLADLAWNPVDNTMYGVFSQGYMTARLYTVNLQTGAVVVVGQFTGLDQPNNLVGLAIDSVGSYYVFDNINNKIYKSDALLNLTLLYDGELHCKGCFEAVGSQGLAINWSRDDLGYHGAIGQRTFPNYYNNVNTFLLDGAAYIWGPNFGPNYPDGLPLVQPGDLAIVPGTTKRPIPGDVTGDGVVNIDDLLEVINTWGLCTPSCPADVSPPPDGDGLVNIDDLLFVINNWG